MLRPKSWRFGISSLKWFNMARNVDLEVNMRAVKGLSMEKWLCWASMGIAGLLLLLFLVDIFAGFPFGRISLVVDIVGLIACLIVVYLGYDAFRDLR